jgi:small GTP-binding protein
MTTRTLTKKISLLGDPAVGKTSLIQRFVYDAFDDRYLSTIGAKITKKTQTLTVEQNPKLTQDTNLTFLIWDIAGQKAFKSVHQAYYRGSEAALIVCDITRRETLDNILEWISELYKVVGNVPTLILINKYDLKDQVSFGEREINAIAAQVRVPYYFTSAKSGHNVENAFKTLAEFVLGTR